MAESPHQPRTPSPLWAPCPPGAVAALDDGALSAVLAHERHHARRRDPLRLATGRVLARALFFLPELRDLVNRQQALAELDTFIKYQFPSGKLPVRVEFVGHHFTGYNTLRTRPKVVSRAGGVFSDPIDPNALFIIAAREYLDRSGVLSFCHRFDPSMADIYTHLSRAHLRKVHRTYHPRAKRRARAPATCPGIDLD